MPFKSSSWYTRRLRRASCLNAFAAAKRVLERNTFGWQLYLDVSMHYHYLERFMRHCAWRPLCLKEKHAIITTSLKACIDELPASWVDRWESFWFMTYGLTSHVTWSIGQTAPDSHRPHAMSNDQHRKSDILSIAKDINRETNFLRRSPSRNGNWMYDSPGIATVIMKRRCCLPTRQSESITRYEVDIGHWLQGLLFYWSALSWSQAKMTN